MVLLRRQKAAAVVVVAGSVLAALRIYLVREPPLLQRLDRRMMLEPAMEREPATWIAPSWRSNLCRAFYSIVCCLLEFMVAAAVDWYNAMKRTLLYRGRVGTNGNDEADV